MESVRLLADEMDELDGNVIFSQNTCVGATLTPFILSYMIIQAERDRRQKGKIF